MVLIQNKAEPQEFPDHRMPVLRGSAVLQMVIQAQRMLKGVRQRNVLKNFVFLTSSENAESCEVEEGVEKICIFDK